MSGRTRPQRAAARSLLTRSRTSACCSNAIRSAAAIKPWVGRTQAVGHRVIPLDRINSATASQSSSDILTPPYQQPQCEIRQRVVSQHDCCLVRVAVVGNPDFCLREIYAGFRGQYVKQFTLVNFFWAGSCSPGDVARQLTETQDAAAQRLGSQRALR